MCAGRLKTKRAYFRMRLDAVLGDLEETAALVLEAALEQAG